MTFSTELIVLSTTKLGEKSLVVHCLTPSLGRRSFISGIPSGGGMALFLPLNILEGEVSENPRSDLWRVRHLTAISPLSGIRSSVSKNSITLFMSEVLYRTVRDGAMEDGLFDWCKRSIMTLDALQSDFSNFHLRFLLEFAVALGFSPSLSDLAPFAGEHLSEVRALLESDFGQFMLIPLNGLARNEIAEILLQYIGYHSDCRLNIRSLAVLRELWR
mgnify:CR=1 FL=1